MDYFYCSRHGSPIAHGSLDAAPDERSRPWFFISVFIKIASDLDKNRAPSILDFLLRDYKPSINALCTARDENELHQVAGSPLHSIANDNSAETMLPK